MNSAMCLPIRSATFAMLAACVFSWSISAQAARGASHPRKTRAPKESILASYDEVREMDLRLRMAYFIAVRDGFSKPLSADGRGPRGSAFMTPAIPRRLPWEAIFESAASAQTGPRARTAPPPAAPEAATRRTRATGVFTCARGGDVYAGSSEPGRNPCTEGVETFPEVINIPAGYVYEPNRGQSAVNVSCPDLPDRNGTMRKMRVCNPFVYGMSVTERNGEKLLNPFCVALADPTERRGDLRCLTFADGRQRMDARGDFRNYTRPEDIPEQQRMRAETLAITNRLVQVNGPAYEQQVERINEACSARNIADIRGGDDAQQRRALLAMQCADLRTMVGRVRPELLNGLCRIDHTGLKMPMMCQACLIEDAERRRGNGDYKVNRAWLALLNMAPRMCNMSGERRAQRGAGYMAEALATFGYCAETENDPLQIPDEPRTVADLNARVADGSVNDTRLEGVYGYSRDQLQTLLCARNRGALGAILTTLEADAGTSARKRRFVACAREAIKPDRARSNSGECRVTNARPGMENAASPTPMVGPPPSDLVMTIAPTIERGQRTEQCRVTLGLNVDRRGQLMGWNGFSPEIDPATTPVLKGYGESEVTAVDAGSTRPPLNYYRYYCPLSGLPAGEAEAPRDGGPARDPSRAAS